MAIEDLAITAKDHEVRIDGCLARVGIIRFDAYEDLGGRQSTSVAFLDSRENGVVVTTVVSREFARMYVKTLKDGRADIPLAPEETEAFDQARAGGGAPFTVRPRLERILEEKGIQIGEPAAETPAPTDAEEESEAALRALERENRRRLRRGLPPLEELPPAPSTLGWAQLQRSAGRAAEAALLEDDGTAEIPPELPPASDLELDETEGSDWAPEWEDLPPRESATSPRGEG
jgi:hypothetical protein